VTRPEFNVSRWGRGGCIGLLVAGVIFLGLLFGIAGWNTVDAGRVGVTRRFGEIQDVKGAGGFWANPLGFSVVEYDLRVAKRLDGQEAALKNQQTLSVDSVAYQYNLTPEAARQLLETVGDQETFENNVVVPRLQSAIKRITPQYTADQVFPLRSEMERKMEQALAQDLAEYRIAAGSVDITLADMNFDPEYRKSINAKAKAEQDKQVELANLDKQKTQNERELQQARTDAAKAQLAAEGQAKAAQAQAAGEAQAIRLRAAAEAEANTAVARSVTPALINYRYALNWNGQLPTTTLGGDGASPFFMLPGSTQAQQPATEPDQPADRDR
jgi:regulator of protease activity HflC (stomatin/prohibitin superfamily)